MVGTYNNEKKRRRYHNGRSRMETGTQDRPRENWIDVAEENLKTLGNTRVDDNGSSPRVMEGYIYI